MLDQFVEFCHSSLHFIADKIENKKLRENLKRAKINYSASEFMSSSILSCMLISIFIFFVLFFVSIPALTKISVSLVVFCALFYISLKIPEKMAQARERKIEEQLLQETRTIILELKMDCDFEEIIRNRISNSVLGSEFKAIYSKTKNGKPLDMALLEFGQNYKSRFASQVTSQLALIYNKGNKNLEGLEKILETKARENLAQIKEKNQKQIYYSMLFVASSTVLPAMLQAYLAISSAFMKINYNEIIWIVILALISVNIFLLVRMSEN